MTVSQLSYRSPHSLVRPSVSEASEQRFYREEVSSLLVEKDEEALSLLCSCFALGDAVAFHEALELDLRLNVHDNGPV